MSDSTLDAVDYGILTCIEEHEQVWKKRVHELISERHDVLPNMKEVSIQTVGRRINNLQENGLLQSCILSPDGLNRDLIIGYQVTSTGQEAMREKREDILRNKVLLSGECLLGGRCDNLSVNRDALNHLFCKHFDVDPENRDVVEQCGTHEILSVLAIHYFREYGSSALKDDNMDNMTALVEAAQPIKESFTASTPADNLLRQVRNGGNRIKEKILQQN